MKGAMLGQQDNTQESPHHSRQPSYVHHIQQQKLQPYNNITRSSTLKPAPALSLEPEPTLRDRFIRVGLLLAEAERHHRMRSRQIKVKNSATRRYACTAREDILWKALRNHLDESIRFHCIKDEEDDADLLDPVTMQTRTLKNRSGATSAAAAAAAAAAAGGDSSSDSSGSGYNSEEQQLDSYPSIAEWERQVRASNVALWTQPADAPYALLIALEY